MESKKLKIEDFKIEKISKNQQKIVFGGDGSGVPGDTNRANGNGSL